MPHFTNARTIRPKPPRFGRVERFPKPLIDQIFYKKRADAIRDTIDELVKLAKTSREQVCIVDFGCGTGAAIKNEALIYQTVAHPNLHLIGIDQSIATQRHDGYEVFNDDLRQLEHLKDETVDFGFSCAVLDYVDDKVLALQHIWRTLKFGGKAIVSITPDHFGPYALEMFPEKDDICWDEDFQAVTICKTHSNSASLACARFLYVPIQKVLSAEHFLGPTSVPRPARLMTTYSEHLKYQVFRRRYEGACQSLYVTPEDIEQVLGQDCAKKSNFLPELRRSEALSETTIEKLIDCVLNCYEKYPPVMRWKPKLSQSHPASPEVKSNCCIL